MVDCRIVEMPLFIDMLVVACHAKESLLDGIRIVQNVLFFDLVGCIVYCCCWFATAACVMVVVGWLVVVVVEGARHGQW